MSFCSCLWNLQGNDVIIFCISGQGRSDGGDLEEREHHDPRRAEPVQLCLLHLGLVHRLSDLLSSWSCKRLHSRGQSSHHGRSCRPSSGRNQEVWGAKAEMSHCGFERIGEGADMTTLQEISSSRQHKWLSAEDNQTEVQGDEFQQQNKKTMARPYYELMCKHVHLTCRNNHVQINDSQKFVFFCLRNGSFSLRCLHHINY